MMKIKSFFGAVLAVSLTFPAHAEFPKNWYVEGVRDFLNGALVSTAIQSDGSLTLSSAFEERNQLAANNIMDAVPLNATEMFVATAKPGAAMILRLGESGSEKTLLDLPQGFVSAVAKGKDGSLYAASAPDGRLYKGDKTGLKPIFQAKEQYIWNILPAKDGQIYFTTGNRGALYRLQGDDAELLYQSKESNLRALYEDPHWGLVFGGGSRGIVYQYERKDKARALLDVDFDEVTAITGNGKGDLFVALNRSKADKSRAKSAVFRIDRHGHSELLFPLDNETANTLALNKAGDLFVGTGNAGRIYKIYQPENPEVRELSLATRSASDQVSLLIAAAANDGFLSFGSSPARIDRYEGGFLRTGIYESDVMSTGISASWGLLRLQAVVPSGTQIRVATRTGNTATPDNTWSDWSAFKAGTEVPITSPAGRFLQAKFELQSNSAQRTPQLKSFEVNYVRDNLAPIVHEVYFLDRGIFFKPHTYGKPEAPRVVQLESRVLQSLRQPQSTESVYAQMLEEKSSSEIRMLQDFKQGMLTVAWDSEDANEDRLTFEVYYQAYGQTEWVPLAKDLNQPIYSFDSSTLSDGNYRFRVYASDALSNPGESYRVYRDSELITIDNTVPVVSGLQASVKPDHVEVRFQVKDQMSALAYVETILDGQQSDFVQSVDKIIDGREETFALKMKRPAKGQHMLVVKATDRMGNTSTHRVSFDVR